jgi:hypothetical protein
MLRRRREQQQAGAPAAARRVPQHEHHETCVELSSASSTSTSSSLARALCEIIKHLQYARGQVDAPCDQLEAWLASLDRPQLRSSAARRAAKVGSFFSFCRADAPMRARRRRRTACDPQQALKNPQREPLAPQPTKNNSTRAR